MNRFVLLVLFLVFVLVGSACNFEGFGQSTAIGEENELQATTPRSQHTTFQSALAVGSSTTFFVSRQSDVLVVTSADFSDADLFEVTEFSEAMVSVRALAAGESYLEIAAEDSAGEVFFDRFRVRAAKVARAEMEPLCGVDALYLVEESYPANLRFFDAEDEDLKGDQFFPFDVVSAEPVQISETGDFMKVALQMPAQAGAVEFHSQVDDTVIALETITGEEFDHIEVDEIAVPDELISGQGLILNLKRSYQGQTICDVNHHYRLATLTPEKCNFHSSEGAADQVEVKTDSIPAFLLNLLEAGECTVTIEALHAEPAAGPVIVQRSWTID